MKEPIKYQELEDIIANFDPQVDQLDPLHRAFCIIEQMLLDLKQVNDKDPLLGLVRKGINQVAAIRRNVHTLSSKDFAHVQSLAFDLARAAIDGVAEKLEELTVYYDMVDTFPAPLALA